MKQHVAIEHDETIRQIISRQRQRIKTTRFFKPRVDHKRRVCRTPTAYPFSLKTEHEHDVVDPRFSQRGDLSLQKCLAANLKQTFRLEIHAVQTCSFAGGEYDAVHCFVNYLPG